MRLKRANAFLFVMLLCNKYGYCSSTKRKTYTNGTIWNNSYIAENDTDSYTMLTIRNNSYIDENNTDLYPDYDIFTTPMTSAPFYQDYGGSFSLYEPLTVDEVEELLQRNETQHFLQSFSNENQRKVLTNHLRFCPYTSLCKFSLEIYLGPNMGSPCGMCFCTNDCNLNKNCCPDIADFSRFEPEPKLMQTECFDMSLKKSGSFDNTFQTVTTCSNIGQAGSRSHDLCTNDLDDTIFENILPVTDRTKNITYKNRHCAACNSVPEENIVLWQPKLNCGSSEEKSHAYTTETELIHYVLASETCDLIFSPPFEDVGITYCNQMIETCNETGKWSSFDPFLNSACMFYENIYTVSVHQANVTESDTIIYRNLFCALCNGESPETVYLDSLHYDGGINSKVYAFSGLLKFNSQTEETTDPADDRCEIGFIYDLITDSCLELNCSPLRTLRNDTCEPIFSRIRSVVYIITARLYPIGGWEAVLDNLHIAFHEITDQIDEEIAYFLTQLDLAPRIPEYGMYSFSTTDVMGPCYISLSRGLMDTCHDPPCESQDYGHYEVEVRFEVISEWHDLDDVMLILKELEAIHYKIPVQEVDYLLRLQVRDFGDRIRSPGDALERDRMCNSQAEIVNLSKQRTCPLVLMNLTYFSCFENIVGLSCPLFNITLNSSDYAFLGSNKSLVSVCSDVYLRSFAHSVTKQTNPSSTVPVVLSLICTVISLFCLLFSFVTFCLFPRLRTLPGKNNMALILSLMVAQSMFLISSFGRFERASNQCKTVGLLTHFSWLLAVFWMHVCTFHVFRVFTGIDKLVVESEVKTLTRYFIYTTVLSVSIICLNICVSLLSSDMREFGYGKSSCYISSENMVAFTFGIPVGFVIVTNFIMFLFFVIKIKRTPVIKKDVKNERNDMIVFAKLSSLTGFTWIFGFIYSWTDIEVFSYLFIMLNASQGVFLFLSFVCNKRVFDMFRNRSFGVTATSEAYRTRVTDSTQLSMKRV